MVAFDSSRPGRSLREALVGDLEQIDDNVTLYYGGRRSAYQTVAIQLRGLTSGRRNLVDRVFPKANFHRLAPAQDRVLAPAPPGTDQVVLFGGRGPLKLGGPEGARMCLEWLEPASLTLQEWRAQWVVSEAVTIGKLIDDVSNEEVAHTDEHIGSTIERASVLRFAGPALRGVQMHQLAVIALGEYISQRLRTLSAEDAVAHP